MSDLSNNERKYLQKLRQKKYRQQHRQILIEGIRLCEEALTSDWRLKQLYITEDFPAHSDADRLLGLAGEKHLIPTEIEESEMQQITDTKRSQGIALLADLPEERAFEPDPEWHPHVLLLDGISDPGNLGTLLRSADWFGVRDCLLGPGSVEWSNPKVVRSTMGAVFRMHLTSLDSWPPVLSTLREARYTLIAADVDGKRISGVHQENHPVTWALILGNEAHGISGQLADEVDLKVSIPGEGPGDSLNVAMAGTIFLYELTPFR